MGKKIGIIALLIIGLIGLNIFCRFIYDQSWFSETKFSKELDPFDIITLVVSTGVTIWLGFFITKNLSQQRYEKEYLINDLKVIEEEINSIDRTILQSNSISLDDLLSYTNKLQLSIYRFSKTLDIFNITSVDAAILNSQFLNLYAEVTNLSGNQLSITSVNRNEINRHCTDLVLVTRNIIFMVNTQ